MIKLTTAEGAVIEVEQDVIEQSGTIRNILTDLGPSSQPIPLPNVSGPILTKIIQYCRHHRNDPGRRKDQAMVSETESGSEAAIEQTISQMDDFDHEFCKVDQGTLFDMFLAANFLDIQPLLDVIGYTVAQMMKGKSVEEIRDTFKVKNDFTPEEEAQVRKENSWCEN
ncbi:hypothetical protein GGI07_003521 [Coemansia sp. Benny D115]|nr:hypothetical protein GGI07_003521 [Coemansia sp. Benny D115]